MYSRFAAFFGAAFLIGATAVSLQLSAKRSAPIAPTKEEDKIIECRVLEAHPSAENHTTIVIFHQRSGEFKQHLSDLLKRNSGAAVEWQGGDTKWPGDAAKWQSATVFRLKSCFGRGLLLIPAGGGAPKDGEDFILKFPREDMGAVK